MTAICGVVIAVAIGASSVWAAKKKAASETPLTESGKKLEARYAGQLQAVQAEIVKGLPGVDEQRKAAFLKAHQEEAAARSAELNALRAQDRKPAEHPSKAVYERAKETLALAATNAQPFEQVRRSQMVGTALGEKRAFGFHAGASGFWNGVALYRQREIIEEAKAVTLAAVGEELGEANESDVKYAIETATVTEEDRRIVVDKKGVIAIPAAACSKPVESTGKVIFMPSVLGDLQLHYSRTGGHQEFEYTFGAPAAGKYSLTARVVTPSWKQHLFVAANGAKDAIDIALPFTVGMWDTSEPVEVSLVKGKNVLTFSREGEVKGVTIKEFALTPGGK